MTPSASVTCNNCSLYLTAQVLGMERLDCSLFNDVVLRDHPVAKNEVLYRKEDPFRYLYLVHSGACASYASMAEYLGLASETVIRVLQSLHNQQFITIKAK